MLTVPTTMIEDWANSMSASSDLPRWIEHLIHATCSDVFRLDMPYGEHVRLSGPDGIVDCREGNELVPQGTSLWEISCEQDIRGKANSDISKRSQELGALKGSTTFVFATARKFPNWNQWPNDDLKSGWNGVKLIWSHHLAKWFELAPWIATAFLQEVGAAAPSGLKSLSMLWEDYSVAQPPKMLSKDFVIANRRETVAELVSWCVDIRRAASPTIRFAGPSDLEALHFLVAALQDTAEHDFAGLEAVS